MTAQPTACPPCTGDCDQGRQCIGRKAPARDAYAEGQQAFADGKDEDANPFDLRSEEMKYLDWTDGWAEQSEIANG